MSSVVAKLGPACSKSFFVMIPTSFPPFTTGSFEILFLFINSLASVTVVSGSTVITDFFITSFTIITFLQLYYSTEFEFM